ncbi:MAG TPA: glycoside hydrolase family 95 protein, partial [Segetibacter sp.]
MKKPFFLMMCVCSLITVVSAQQNLKLWYQQPALVWTEALPVGNGRLGAMVFGKVGEELIQLNESTLWSGGPAKTNQNPEAPKYLPQIREALLKEEDYTKANSLAKKMQGLYSEGYLPLADLIIKQNFTDSSPSSYYRDLDINNAIATTKFTIDGTTFTREIFVSAPDQVIVVRLTSDKPKALNLLAASKTILHYQNIVAAKDELVVKGKAPSHVDPNYVNEPGRQTVIYEDSTGCNGMRFQVSLKAVTKDGTVETDTSGIHVSNASEVVLVLSAATSFNGFDKCPDKDGKDEAKLAQQHLDKVAQKPYQLLLNNHLLDYHTYFNRVSFTLKDTADNKNISLPSDKRLIAYSKDGYDPGVETLYFNYARYLLISSSRPGGTPANLQGIWNRELRPPWSSNFTININTQMNYWPAEVTNLSEMHEPLFDLIKSVAATGKITAKEFYNMAGWVAHHNTDIWAMSNPV